MNRRIWIARITGYVVGLLVLALGLTLNTKVNLGVAAILSLSFSISEIWELDFGNVTLAIYTVFVVAEIAIHLYLGRKKQIPGDLAQLVFSIVFTRLLNVFKAVMPDFVEDLGGTVWGSMPSRLAFLALAIILTGIGAAMTLNARLVPNPADGIVQAISDLTGKSVGFVKNCVDATCFSITLIFCFLTVGHPVGIGIGTVIAIVGVGRVIAVYNAIVTPTPERKINR